MRLWRSGYAIDCKSIYMGSIPIGRSRYVLMAELVDAPDLKSGVLNRRAGSTPAKHTK
jgi:hypothetical protein